MDRGRIICVHSGGSTLRGSEMMLLDLLTTVSVSNTVLLLCDQQVLATRARELGIHAELIPRGEFMIDGSDRQLNVLGLIRSNLAVRKHIKSFAPDVLYCNSGRALQMSIVAAKITGTPVATHLHAPYTKRYLLLYGTTFADLVIHCSETIKAFHESKVKFRRSACLLNAIDERRFPVDVVRPLNPVPVLGFVGSLIHRKGVDILLQAFKLLRDRGIACKLKIGGHDSGQYAALARELGVPVDFVGEVQRNDIAAFFSDVDIHVFPSRSDAFGLTNVEAAFCGVPTIASQVGGVHEALLNGKLGVLYDENTPEALADHITEMITSDWLGKSAEIARLARSEFSLTNMGAKFMALVEQVKQPSGTRNTAEPLRAA